MRIATLVVGLLWGALIFIQSMTAGVFSSDGSDTSTAAGAGLLMAILWLLASALVIAFPQISMVLFGLSSLLGIFTQTGAFGDLRVHGFAALILVAMSFLGWRGKRRRDSEAAEEKQRQRERDALLEQMLLTQSANSSSRDQT